MKNLTDTITTIGIGGTGIAAAHVMNAIDPSVIQSVVNIAVQILIGLVTLWGLFAKKKS